MPKDKKKKANGEGSWRKRGSGYELRKCFGYDMDGELIRKSFYGRTQRECKQKAEKYKESIKNKQAVAQEYTVGDWLIAWLKLYKSESVSEQTYENYLFNANNIRKHSLSDKFLHQTKPMHIAQFFKDQITEDYSQSVLDKMYMLLNAAFTSAIDNDLCHKNPVSAAGKKVSKRPVEQAQELKSFSDYAYHAIIEYAPKHPFGWVMVLLLGSGLRSGEIRAIRGKHFRLSEKYIIVKDAVKRNGKIGPTKNGKTRYVPIKDDVIKAVEKHVGADNEFVLTGSAIKFFSREQFRNRYDKFFEDLNAYLESQGKETVTPLPPHSTRHTFASRLANAGVSQKAIQLVLGHSDLKTTDIYTHFDELDYLTRCILG